MPKGKTYKKIYTTSDLDVPLQVARCDIPLGACSKKYGVPKTTHFSRLKKNLSLDVKNLFN